jgi:hypothetical protein
MAGFYICSPFVEAACKLKNNIEGTIMQLKKIGVCLTVGLLVSCGATAENYRWDNVAVGGGGDICK